jgi:hypothetical protein
MPQNGHKWTVELEMEDVHRWGIFFCHLFELNIKIPNLFAAETAMNFLNKY